MRINFKYIVVIGLLLAAAETWWKVSRRKGTTTPVTAETNDAVKAFARESNPSAVTIPVVPVTNWTVQLGAVLKSGNSTTNQAISLLAMFPSLPADGQLEAVQHATRLLPAEYFSALGAQLTNTAAAPAVRRAIFADLLARPNALKLPWLVEVAQASLDGQSDEALLLLQSQLREDHGSNWNTWRERVAVWLSLHPDPSPPPNPGGPVSN